MREALVVLALATLSACDASHSEPAARTDGATVADAGVHDAAHDRASSSDAGSTGTCPLLNAATCGVGLTPCAGCCVESQCIAEGDSCGEGLPVCHDASCGGRGGLGEPCAQGKAAVGLNYDPDGAVTCAYEGWTGCSDTRAVCAEGECVACGLAGQPCCDLGCGPDTYCDPSGTCSAACGAVGQQCCGGDTAGFSCHDAGACVGLEQGGINRCVSGASCQADAGSCTTCGNEGQPCCPGEVCNANSLTQCLGDAGCMQEHKK